MGAGAVAGVGTEAGERELENGNGQLRELRTLREVCEDYAREVSPTKRWERWERIRLDALCRHAIADRDIDRIDAQLLGKWRDDRLSVNSAGAVLLARMSGKTLETGEDVMKSIIATVLALSCATASAWQQFNATTIGPNGPSFTYGNIYGGGRAQQFSTTTIRPGGGIEFGYGNVNRYQNVDQFNYYQYGGNSQPRATFGNVYRQMMLDDD